MYVFIKGITRKTNCYWHVRFFFDLYQVSRYKKRNLRTYYIRYTQKARRKKLFKKNEQQQEAHSQTIKKSRFKRGLHGRINNTHMYSSITIIYQQYSFIYIYHLRKNMKSTLTLSIDLRLKVTRVLHFNQQSHGFRERLLIKKS